MPNFKKQIIWAGIGKFVFVIVVLVALAYTFNRLIDGGIFDVILGQKFNEPGMLPR